jgi:hypothetical protein
MRKKPEIETKVYDEVKLNLLNNSLEESEG